MCGKFARMDPTDAGVIEVDVRDEDLPHVLEPDPLPRQRRRQVIEGRRRPRVDQRHAGRSVEDRRRDDLGPAEEIEVDVVESGRERRHRTMLPEWVLEVLKVHGGRAGVPSVLGCALKRVEARAGRTSCCSACTCAAPTSACEAR